MANKIKKSEGWNHFSRDGDIEIYCQDNCKSAKRNHAVHSIKICTEFVTKIRSRLRDNILDDGLCFLRSHSLENYKLITIPWLV